MGHMPIELTFEECVRGLTAGVVGRVGLALPDGPRIVPVNYTVQDDSIVLRTSPYSEVGTYGVGALIAFEVDDFDADLEEGWSVVVRGRTSRIDDADELARLKTAWDPKPWAAGMRTLHLRLPWQQVSGRRLGGGFLPGELPTSHGGRPA